MKKRIEHRIDISRTGTDYGDGYNVGQYIYRKPRNEKIDETIPMLKAGSHRYVLSPSFHEWFVDNGIKYSLIDPEPTSYDISIVFENENDYMRFKLAWV